MNKRFIAGVLLIIVSIGALAAWEIYGKEKLLYASVVVASRTIAAGEIITGEMLAEKNFAKELIVDEAVLPDKINEISGKVAKSEIAKNSQISTMNVYADDFYLKEDEAIYELKNGWIYSVSSSIRRGDTVSLYSKDGAVKIGTYKIAFVKDNARREISSPDGKEPQNSLERTQASSVISTLEIIATLDEYKNIFEIAQDGETFLVVQENREGDI